MDEPRRTGFAGTQTVTFTAPKIGQLVSVAMRQCWCAAGGEYRFACGADRRIGKGNLRWAGPEEFAEIPLVRAADSHKGTFGHVLAAWRVRWEKAALRYLQGARRCEPGQVL